MQLTMMTMCGVQIANKAPYCATYEIIAINISFLINKTYSHKDQTFKSKHRQILFD